MWFVYVLLCGDQSLYTGCTNDVAQRLQTHQRGKGGKYTRAHLPVKLVYQEECVGKSQALQRELEIKSWPRQRKITQLALSLGK